MTITATRRWRCKKYCGRIYPTMREAVDCRCPIPDDKRLDELATCLKAAFNLPQTTYEIALLLGRSKRKKYDNQQDIF